MHANILTAPIGPTLARLAAPNVLAMFVTLATSMAEAFYVGQLGTAALAGLALAFPMMMLSMMISGGSIGGAISGAVAQRLGAGDKYGAELISVHALILSLMLAVLFSAGFLIFGPNIYAALGGRGEALSAALAYSDVFYTGCFTMWLAMSLNSVIRATGNMKMAANSMMLGSLVQVIVAGLFVFGYGPFPATGISGAAFGSVVGYSVSATVQIWFLTRRSETLTLHLKGIQFQLSLIKDLLRVGALASISPVSSVATVIVVTGTMARFGDDVLAGYGIGARMEFLMIPLIFGIGSASITMVGAHFGAGEYKRALKIGWTAALSAGFLSGAVGIALALWPSVWADLFSDSEAVREACRAYLQIVGPFYAFFGLGLCLYFASQGARKMFWPVMGAALRLAVVVVGGLILGGQTDSTATDFFILIAGAMAAYGLVTAAAIKLGAWNSRQSTSSQ